VTSIVSTAETFKTIYLNVIDQIHIAVAPTHNFNIPTTWVWSKQRQTRMATRQNGDTKTATDCSDQNCDKSQVRQELLDTVVTRTEPVYLVKDLNIQLDRTNDVNAVSLVDQLSLYGFNNRVTAYTPARRDARCHCYKTRPDCPGC